MSDAAPAGATPEFVTRFRGYHRAQVDEFVDATREWFDNASARIKAAEAEAARWRDEALQMGQRIAQLEQEASKMPPRTFAAFQERLARVLDSAEETTAAMIADAEAEAQGAVASARERAATSANQTTARLIAEAREMLEAADVQRRELLEAMTVERSQRAQLSRGVGSLLTVLTELVDGVTNFRDSLQDGSAQQESAAVPAPQEPAPQEPATHEPASTEAVQ